MPWASYLLLSATNLLGPLVIQPTLHILVTTITITIHLASNKKIIHIFTTTLQMTTTNNKVVEEFFPSTIRLYFFLVNLAIEGWASLAQTTFKDIELVKKRCSFFIILFKNSHINLYNFQTNIPWYLENNVSKSSF